MDLKSLISILIQYSTIKLRGSSKAKGTQVTLPQTIHDCLTNQGETEKDATAVLKKDTLSNGNPKTKFRY